MEHTNTQAGGHKTEVRAPSIPESFFADTSQGQNNPKARVMNNNTVIQLQDTIGGLYVRSYA